jgi:hypothetical protein
LPAPFQPNRQKAPVLSAGYLLGRAPDTPIGATEKRWLFLHLREFKTCNATAAVSLCGSTMIGSGRTACTSIACSIALRVATSRRGKIDGLCHKHMH